jgi:SAM-dependent methyltransferase
MRSRDATNQDSLHLPGSKTGGARPGPGTQAMQRARRGFVATAADISRTAIRLAKTKAKNQPLDITWKRDNILEARLDRPFGFIFDPGCFHVLAPRRRRDYIRTVARLLKTGSHLFLNALPAYSPGNGNHTGLRLSRLAGFLATALTFLR